MAKPPPPDVNLPHRLGRFFLRRLIHALGVLTLVLLLLALTPLPGLAYGWLGRAAGDAPNAPDVIVMMGGGGIPSESGLMRCYETAVQATHYPKARIIVAMPREPGETNGKPSAVVREIMLRGVDRSRIAQEGRGRHTREQALELWKMTDGARHAPAILVVSSPEHIRRSVLAFRKAGFKQVGGAGAYSQHLQADLSLPSASPVPNPAHSELLRYRVWENVGVEIKVLRELTALLYYRIRGWI